MRIDYPIVNKDILLQLAAKAMNDTLGPEGLLPSSLFFCELTRVCTRFEIPKSRESLGERAKMVHTARIEMDIIIAKMRTARALKNDVLAAADMVFDPEYQVLVSYEKDINRRLGECLGPFIVLNMNQDMKLVYV